MDNQTLELAQQKIGHTFSDRELLVEALTHASIADSRVLSNERLEFLGDAVLGMVVCEHLFSEFPDLLEGDMTKIKSAAVSRRTCAVIADSLGLTDLLKLGKGMQTHHTLPSSLAAAALESIIGAVYLDGGYEAARDFLMPHLAPFIQRSATSGHQHNFKSVLQHVAQEQMDATPMYILLDEKGPDHAKCFEVCVQIGADRYESSWGASKKQAEQQAALNALNALGILETDENGEVTLVNGEETAAAG
ncbi:MAG: ribonuclease III [Phycisphaeraceae bacterium]|nr:MAG: ribonuclease III [Phycisphaeraceae bacterium]